MAFHNFKKQKPCKAESGQQQRLQSRGGKVLQTELKQLLILTLPYKSDLYVEKAKLQGEKYFPLYYYLLLPFSMS